MAGLRVPTIQHLARNWRSDPAAIANTLIRLADDPPRFNYNPLFSAVRDLLVLRVPYDQVVLGVGRIKREKVRQNLLSIMPLIRDHFEGIHPDFCQIVERRYYPVGRGLMVPFEPPLMYGIGGQLFFPWFSFWRSNPLASERLSLFVTLVDEVLSQDPDLETARFEILDFSAPNARAARELKVIDARAIPRIGDARKAEMLETFAEGYFEAMTTLAGRSPTSRAEDGETPSHPHFPGFF